MRADHPLAGIFPLLSGQAGDDLAADIATHGLREPIALLDSMILDGRNRYRACIQAGIEPRFYDYTGEDPIGFVVSLNLHRRHLSESQRAMVAAKLANLQPGDNQHTSGRANLPDLLGAKNIAAPVSSAKAADMLSVSERSVKTARAVQAQGVPELVAAVERGQAAVSAAAAVARLPPVRQAEIVAQGPAAIKAARKEVRDTARKAALGDAVVPTPTKAKEQAIESGSYVLATDGNLHGPDEPAERQKQLDLYQFRDLVRDLAAVTVAPARALEVMTPADRHFLRPATDIALAWLAELKELFDGE